jgi:hypothetical protein
VIVCEHDESTGAAVAAELAALLGDCSVSVEQQIANDPATLLRSRSGPLPLFSPRLWATLPEQARSHPRALELRYVLDPAELQAMAAALGREPTAQAEQAKGGR